MSPRQLTLWIFHHWCALLICSFSERPRCIFCIPESTLRCGALLKARSLLNCWKQHALCCIGHTAGEYILIYHRRNQTMQQNQMLAETKSSTQTVGGCSFCRGSISSLLVDNPCSSIDPRFLCCYKCQDDDKKISHQIFHMLFAQTCCFASLSSSGKIFG